MKKEIIKRIKSLSGSRSPYDVYCDWIKCMALSIQNSICFVHDETWRKREEEFLAIMRLYAEDSCCFAEMFALLTETLECNIGDVLGEIYMESGCGNKNTGQFFTPFHLSELCANLNLTGVDGTQKVYLNEPSCGGGGMIIAAAKVLKDQGVEYQNCLRVVAQDLDWKAVYMCYVQLSLLGVDAVVVQGNTLQDPDWTKRPPECIFRTPRRMGVIF